MRTPQDGRLSLGFVLFPGHTTALIVLEILVLSPTIPTAPYTKVGRMWVDLRDGLQMMLWVWKLTYDQKTPLSVRLSSILMGRFSLKALTASLQQSRWEFAHLCLLSCFSSRSIQVGIGHTGAEVTLLTVRKLSKPTFKDKLITWTHMWITIICQWRKVMYPRASEFFESVACIWN